MSKSPYGSAFVAAARKLDGNDDRGLIAGRESLQNFLVLLARLAKDQEDRQNAEAQESFLAQQQQLSVNRPLKS